MLQPILASSGILSPADVEAQRKRDEARRFTDDLGSARSSNLGLANSVISSFGLNPSQFSSQVNSGIDRAASGLTPGSNPSSAIDGRTIAQSILDDELRGQRTQLTNQANQKFGQNFGSRLISDNLLDGTVDDIVGTQRKDANSFVERGRLRGIFNESGVSAANDAINNSYSAGRSQVGNIADGILDGYRTQADGVRDRAFSSAQGFTFGNNIDFDEMLGEGNRIASRATERADGDLRSAVGGQNFFDTGAIRNTAGQAQGVINSRDTDVGAALERRKRQASVGRGLGSEGAF